MQQPRPNILLLEPYFGGSHRTFIRGMEKHLDCRFTKITLPPRKWKMRMQLAAPWMAEKTAELVWQGERFDCALCFSLLDAATYRVLLQQVGIELPLGIYFHENQFAYPNRLNDPQFYQFTALNFTSALAADALAFNSHYNRDTFLAGVNYYLKKAADMDILHLVDTLRHKSTVLYPGMNYAGMKPQGTTSLSAAPVIIWNHRWEHDKDPDTFFRVLFELADEGADFRLIVLGQNFATIPSVFKEARKRLAGRIDHFGYVRKRKDYVDLLRQGTIVVSTARHEFFGISMLEAVRCGCRPLVPDSLSYPELFPEQYRYRDAEELKQSLRRVIGENRNLDPPGIDAITGKYSWEGLYPDYTAWFSRLARKEKSSATVCYAGKV